MAASFTVAVVGGAGIAPELGKKGTASDITLYNDVRGQRAITFVEPTQFPEKLAPLFVALGMADRCLLAVPELTRPVAETIAAVELTELPVTIARGAAVGEAELARALRGSRLERDPQVALDPTRLREELAGWTVTPRDGSVEVAIDHAFPVKGVGAVALGVVRQGTVRAHERLRLWPTEKIVEVRSIQVHDIDRKEAASGERVGVALKGVDAEELDRGQLLAPEGRAEAGPVLVGGPLARCRYYRGDARPGAQIHVALGLQVVPATLEGLSDEGVRLTCDRPVVGVARSAAFLLDLSVPAGPRIVGRTELKSIGVT